MTNKTYKKHSTKVIKEGKKTYIINSFVEDESTRKIANILFTLMLRELEKDK
ncbi:hypothetical protein [Enterococcus faecalis]|uniref:hypothetical protein n=1 Tax=Enterococcus faecalis TaxID=1351 RepID=UPI001325E188|nr:hypothetical protein [Enterococcus faecalis]MXS28372.1 hypothetical protein [Enterococcus faecalis]